MPRVDLTRLRWRLSGATMWPLFVVLVLVEGVLLNALPVWGSGPGGFVPALLLAAGLNLIVVAGLAPLAGMLLRRRRRDLPRAIATDRCGAVLVGVLFAAFIAGGAVNHSAVARDDRDRSSSYAATSAYVHTQAQEFLPTLDSMSAVRVEVGIYRTCVPGDEPERPLCLFVNTDQSPPGVTRDPERIPNYLWRR